MKRTAAFILLMALLAQTSNRFAVLFNYEIHKNTISKTLCINRDKPMLGCNGKCYLKKQLEKAARETSTPSNGKSDRNETLFFMGHKKLTTWFFAEELSLTYLLRQQPVFHQNDRGDVFHPPQAA